jgi:periplasmic protein CpxP/Spy
MRRTITTTIAGAALLVASAALAFGPHGGGGFGGRPGMGDGPLLPLRVMASVMNADQRQQLRDIMRTNGPKMHAIAEQLRKAHEALADRFFAPGSLAAGDLATQLQQIATLRDQLVQNALATALQVRGLLSTDQLAQAASKKDQLRSLHDQMESLIGHPGSPDDPSAD